MKTQKTMRTFSTFAIIAGMSFTLAACSSDNPQGLEKNNFGVDASNIKKDSIAKEAEQKGLAEQEVDERRGANENNTQAPSAEVKSLEESSNEASPVVTDVFNSLSGDKLGYTPEDLDNGVIFKEVEKLLGKEVFFDNSLGNDVKASIDTVDEQKINDTNAALEEKFPMSRDKTNYAALTPSEKVLFNTYMAILQAEINTLDNVEFTGIDNEIATVAENGDLVLPPGAVTFTYKDGESALYDTSMRMYNDGSEWKLDAIDFISQYYVPGGSQ